MKPMKRDDAVMVTITGVALIWIVVLVVGTRTNNNLLVVIASVPVAVFLAFAGVYFAFLFFKAAYQLITGKTVDGDD